MSIFPTPDIYQADIWANMRIGILGGSFNPAHDGHRHISLMAMKKLKLDAVWWLITPQNPLKDSKETAPIAARIKSATMIAKHPRLLPTALETKLKTQYTADTLPKIIHYFPKTNFVWLMGMDNLHNIHKWQEWQTIFKTMPIAVLNRPPHDDAMQNSVAGQYFKRHQVPEHHAIDIFKQNTPTWTILHLPLHGESSTNIRNQENAP